MKENGIKMFFYMALAIMVSVPQMNMAQKKNKFEEAIARGWIEQKGYAYEDKVEGTSKREKFRKKSQEMGYVIHYFGVSSVYFYRSNEKERLDNELQQSARALEYSYLVDNLPEFQIKKPNFKSVGTAFIYDANVQRNGQGKTPWRVFIKCNDVKWTGNLNNGCLEGEGYGYVRAQSHGEEVPFVFKGTFQNGFMIKGTFVRPRRRYSVELSPFSDGVAWLKDDTFNSDGDNDGWKYSLIDSEGRILIRRNIPEVRSNFKDGKATIAFGEMEAVINKSGRLVSIVDGSKEIPSNCFDGNSFFWYVKSVVIPSSVTKIGYRAFYRNTDIESVVIPSSVTEIGKEAFCGCSKLKQIDIPSSVSKIGTQAFSGCTALTTITLPKSIMDVGKQAFQSCHELTSAALPKSLEAIAKKNTIFKNCDKLNGVDLVTDNGSKTRDDSWQWKYERDPNEPIISEPTIDPEKVSIPDYTDYGDWEKVGDQESKFIKFRPSGWLISIKKFYLKKPLNNHYVVYQPTNMILASNWYSCFYASEKDAAAAAYVYENYKLIRKTGLVD